MPNHFVGICYRCGEPIEPGKGVFEKTGRPQMRKWQDRLRYLPKWLTQHHQCAVDFGGTDQHYLIHGKPTALEGGEK